MHTSGVRKMKCLALVAALRNSHQKGRSNLIYGKIPLLSKLRRRVQHLIGIYLYVKLQALRRIYIWTIYNGNKMKVQPKKPIKKAGQLLMYTKWKCWVKGVIIIRIMIYNVLLTRIY